MATMGNERKKSEERRSLSEYESKRRLARYDIPVVNEELVTSADAALEAAHRIGLPVVLKACGSGLAHKTDLGVVEHNLRDDNAVTEAYNRIV